MPKPTIWKAITIFETGLSAAEWAWRILTLVFVGASGTITGLLAKSDPLLKQLGPIYWILIGIITSFMITLVLFFIKYGRQKQAESEYYQIMSVPRNTVNPLLDSFTDLVIPIEDLRLPTIQMHNNKLFKRCKLVGPGAVAILGGTYNNNKFNDCGDIAVLPEFLNTTGIIVLQNCTVEECELIRVSVFTDNNTARGFLRGGFPVKGLKA
jgi:hypothetical protein